MKKFTRLDILAFVVVGLLSVGTIGLYVWRFSSCEIAEDPVYFGVFGDDIGGVLGSIVALISIVLLYRTYISQLDIANRQEEQQNIQQFEVTLFELITRQRNLAKDVDNWHGIREQLETELTNFAYEPSYLKSENRLLIQKRVSDGFYDVYQARVSQLGAYFRHLQFIMSYIEDHAVDKDKYCSMLQAQMTDDELYVIFFYGLSLFGYKNMHPILDRYQVLRALGAMDDTILFLEKLFYPNTRFLIPAKNAKNVVIVGGIHGAGKSTYCDAIKKDFPELELLSASKVLRWKDPTIKEVHNVGDNQELLIQNLQKIVSFEKQYVLDGHFCLIESGEIKEVPFSTFERINPAFLILVEEDVHTIVERLKKRDHVEVNMEMLGQMKEKELKWAMTVADKLGVRLYRVHGNVVTEDVKSAIKMEL